MKKIVFAVMCVYLFLCHGVRVQEAHAVCAQVNMQITQELTLERVAFDARLVITNNLSDKALQNIRVDVLIRDQDGNLKNNLFFTKVASLSNIDSVDGGGTVAAGSKAEVHWLIIPSPGAGGASTDGIAYFVGATLTYSIDGSQETVPINPDRITVKPTAQLMVDYFMPYEVLGDNPYTQQVEPSVPFPLAVRVLNDGFGPATNLKIDAVKPQIASNAQGLLVDFKLLDAAVNDALVQPSLILNMGTVESKKIATAYWDMTSTLSGIFSKFDVSFSHSSELGGELTSLIKEMHAYYLVHRVKVNLPGRDSHLDFLVDTDKDPDHLPDTISESEIPGNSGKIEDAQSPVTVVAVLAMPGYPTASSPEVQMSVQTGQSGWVYTKLADPSQGLLKILDVVRADGVHLDPNNFWVQEGLDANYQQTFTLHLLDYRAAASALGTYKLVYTQPADDTTPPSTKLVFDGPATGIDPMYSITPATRIILLATDNDGGSGVDQMFKKVVGTDADFVAAYPLTLDPPGTYTLEYYSKDRAGNVEAVKTATIVVDSGAPSISTFQATPSTIMPYAPRGIAAARTMNFAVKATDDQSSLQATIEIGKGAAFTPTGVVRTLKAAITKDVESSILWDGKDSIGALVPTGTYTVRLSVTDSLDSSTATHTATSTVTVTIADWFVGQPLDPNIVGAQQHPRVSGTRVVWQDNRSGNWHIYTRETAGASSTAITNNASDQMYPAISGNIIVWQDNRNNNWDIYGYDLTQSQEFVICIDAGNQERPVIDGNWVSWQDDRDGNWDIFAYNLTTHEQIRITGHVRDQMHPAISNTTLAWEDYRFGLGEMFTYDLTNLIETRYTVDSYNQTLPATSGSTLVWTDQRNNQRDIYFSPTQNNQVRVTYGTGDHSQATISDHVIVYTDYEAGAIDPNLAFYDTQSGIGALLAANPARQEEPALGAGVLVWQDDRDGVSQIYWSNFQVEAVPIAADIKPGLNLIAVGDKLAALYPATSTLIAAKPSGITIEKIVVYNSQNGTFMDTGSGTDIALQKGMGIGLYAAGSGSLDIADSGETTQYTLLPGLNYIGMLSLPNGYTAYSMLQSIGYDNVQSVRRFNNQTGAWETASIRDVAGVKAPAGANFTLRQGDGVVITMKIRVDGWKP